RGLARMPQLAIQAALGASRARLLRSLVIESALLAIGAGVAGLLVAAAATTAIRAIGPAYAARLVDVRLDLRLVAGAVVVSAITGMLIGLAPAVPAWRRDLRVTGVDGGRRSAAGAAARLRQLFVIGECAAAIVLLAGAGLLARSWWNLSRVDPGFRAERVVSMNLAPPADLPSTARAAFYEAVLERVTALPGVERAGISSELFVGTVGEQSVVAEGGDRVGAQPLPLRRDEIAGAVFDTLGTPLQRGRDFVASDGRGAGLVAIVNATMAARLWPGRDAIGRRFAFGGQGAPSPWFTVVGVVADMRRQGLETASVPQMFEPVAQAPSRRAILFVRTSHADPSSGASAVRAAVRAVEPKAVVYHVARVGDRIGLAVAERRVQTALLLGGAAMTLLLAAIGLYALIQHSVVTRTHEIGVRMALGARPSDIGRMVVGEGLVLAAVGLGVGLASAWALARTALTLLFGVGAFDPPTLVTVSVVAIVVAAAASYLPARRATRVAPIVALRTRAL
ncbi:MAG: FtsX-like permease family protein, partial [Vicinamibacteraceae bacterium]